MVDKTDAPAFIVGTGENCPLMRAKVYNNAAQVKLGIARDKNTVTANEEKGISS